MANQLDTIAALVELGVPTEMATRVFLAGLRSRQSATEIAAYLAGELEGMNLGQIRRFLVRPDVRTRLADVATELTQKWLDILDTDARFAQQQPVACDDFLLPIEGRTNLLHARNYAGKTYLCSSNYDVVHEVGSNDRVPFHLLQNDIRYIFTNSEECPDVWSLRIRDPHLQLQ